ncbi:isoleucyl-tRNA synthetase [Ephemerocybe angulata]|uniref:Isoleucine--tRNA ligase, mitochondrial n=1 Tax=Ephemerocybe angulata TaxID=980116 RepID=A0A8H6HZS7_9AGAR|nr:isoleucyl-tRNA synthetase [Tulosesus angulatus]
MLRRATCPRAGLAILTSRLRAGYASTASTSSEQAKLDSKAFAKTLQLPNTPFPLWANVADVEGKYRASTCDSLYKWQWENNKGPVFVLHDGPPYANGNLHMGHALNKVLKDMINRFHLLQGRRVHYIPGWDCHGLPIENKTLKDLKVHVSQLSPSEIREACQATASNEVESQKAQFRALGIMADWDSEGKIYRTLDHKYEMRQLRIFQKMVEKGLIYRHYRPVHYSPSSLSALAEAELEYKDDHVSHSVYVTFDLEETPNETLRSMLDSQDVKLLVWTTTPWTLTANMGIAVHPDLVYSVVKSQEGVLVVAKDRVEALTDIIGETEVLAQLTGQDLLGTSYRPIFSALPNASTQALKVVPASHVTSDSGTGLVHCAPAHGTEDYQAFRAQGLISNSHSMICHVGSAGEFVGSVAEVVGEEAAEKLVNKSVLKEGSRAAVDLLREVGQVVKVKRIKHRYPYDWKTDEPIILTATSQWFANLDDIKENALEALQEVAFIPPISRNRLEAFVKSRSEWCISRQRVWGVPIPALYEIATDKAILNSSTLDHILSVIEKKGTSYWWSGPVEEFLPPSILGDLKAKDLQASDIYRKGTDTMDVWFDSGSSWSMLPDMGVGQSPTRRFHADVCLEGSDQHRGWFQSQLLTAVGAAPKTEKPSSPYAMLLTHGMVLDEKGRKMSKSLGNIVSPLTVINGGKDKKKEPAYGTDVLRLWAATVEYWRDMSIGPTVLSQSAESYRKIRNSARFCLGNMDGVAGRQQLEKVPREKLDLIERYIMHELYKLEQTALDGYTTYNFAKVANALTHFTNITLSSFYFDITKDCLYADAINGTARRGVITVLNHILDSLTKVIAPILPHLAEEIHTTRVGDATSAFMTPWTPLGSEWHDPTAAAQMETYMRLRSSVLAQLEQARMNKHIRSSLEAAVDIVIPEGASSDEFALLLQKQGVDTLKTLFIVSDANIVNALSEHGPTEGWLYNGTFKTASGLELAIRVHAAPLHKCPRCWTYTRPEEETLCGRCSNALHH